MASVTICSDFGAQKNKVWHCVHCFPIYFPWSDGTRCHNLSFLNVELKSTFSLSSFTFIKRLFCSSSLSANIKCCFSPVQIFGNLWTLVHQVSFSLAFSRQEYTRGSSWARYRTRISSVSCIAGGFFTTSTTTWGTSYSVVWLHNCRGLKTQKFFFLLMLQVHQRLDGGSTSSFSSCGPQDDKASALCTLLVKWQKKKRRWQSLCGFFSFHSEMTWYFHFYLLGQLFKAQARADTKA